MEKEVYYISIKNLTCSRCGTGEPTQFRIELEPHRARVFQKLFQQMYTLEWSNAVRAHLPYLPYHVDALNHDIDTRYKKVYALLHEFGDEDTKHFVEQLPYFS